ncbi:MAG: ArsR family transcriptional regulator [Anaerolinea sp.]|nr:ArsR family transcriptional regulator [Anaerolinea sp.]
MDKQTQELLELLKSLADESRIAIIRLLAQQEVAVGDLAKLVNLGEPTVSHHLSKLREVGLVTVRTLGNQRFYRLNESGLQHFKTLFADLEKSPAHKSVVISDNQWIEDLPWDDADKVILQEYTVNHRLTHLPSKQKKLMIILCWLVSLFEKDRLYSELEVNEILKEVYEEDFVSLRRDLIDFGFLRRERGGSKYWKA